MAQAEHGTHRLGERIGHLGIVAGGLAGAAHPVTAEIGPAEAAGDHIDGLLSGEGLVGLDGQVGVQGHTIVVHSGDGVIAPGRFRQVGIGVARNRLYPQDAVENGGELSPGDGVVRVELPVGIAFENAGVRPSVDVGLGPVLGRYVGILRRKRRRPHAADEQHRQEQRLQETFSCEMLLHGDPLSFPCIRAGTVFGQRTDDSDLSISWKYLTDKQNPEFRDAFRVYLQKKAQAHTAPEPFGGFWS